MMKKMMKLWMHLIFLATFTSAYANPVDCDFEEDSCSWLIVGFRRISDNQLNSTDGRNDIMHRNEVNYAVTEFRSTREQSVLTSGFDIYRGEKCLSFKYQMKDFKRECISIVVYSYDEISWSHVWSSQSQSQLHGWNEINVTINVEKKSKIVIRFLHGNCFNVTYYIGSISLKKQSRIASKATFRTSPSTVIPMNSSNYIMTPKITTTNRFTPIVKLSSTDRATSTAATSVNNSSHYANESKATFRTSPSTVIPMNSSNYIMTPKITNKSRFTPIVKVSSTDRATSTAESKKTFRTSPSTVIPMNSSNYIMTPKITNKSRFTPIVKVSSTDRATSTAATSVNNSSHYANESKATFGTSPSTVIPMNSSNYIMTPKITNRSRFTPIVKVSSTDRATSTAATSVNNSSHYANESKKTFRTSPSTVIPMNSSNYIMTPKITNTNRFTPIVKLSSTDSATSTAATSVNNSSHYANDGVIIGIVIGGLAFTVAVLLIATYLYSGRATNPNANIFKHSTVYSVTYSGATRPKTENGEASHSTNNYTMEFRDDTYDCTIMYPTKIPDTTYDHMHFKQNVDTIYDHSKSGTLNKDMKYMDHSCDTTLQRSMQDVDPTYNHT